MIFKKVSVIMGVYNEEELWVRSSIESILNQTYNNLEFIIILDNPKNRHLEQIIKYYEENDERIKFYINEKNIGLIDTLNKAIDLSTGEYIVRMDSDDIAFKDRLEKQIKFLEENKEYALVGSKVQYIDEQGNIIDVDDKRVCTNKCIKEYLKYDNAFAHPTIVYKASIVKQLGKYKDALYAEDYDLILRFVVNGFKVCNINEKLLKYRIRATGISISKKNYQVTTTQYLQKLYCNYINKNKKYDFNVIDLNKLLLEDESKWAKKIECMHNKSLKFGEEGKKISKIFYVLTLTIISQKYFKWYKNRMIMNLKFK